KDYLINYTNAAFVVRDGFKLPEDGLFSGFDAAGPTYDKTTWNYEPGGTVAGASRAVGASNSAQSPANKGQGKKSESTGDGGGHQAAGPVGASAQGGQNPPPMLPANVAYDLSLQHPRSV